jgi:predicted O-linked N-acetylglucosamine transferase (SPINDLY family)
MSKKIEGKPMQTMGAASLTTAEMEELVALFNQARYVEAEALARTMTSNFPQHAFGWKALGATLKQQGRIEEALLQLRKAAVLTPGDAETHYNLGITLQEQGLHQEAQGCFRQSLAIKADYLEAQRGLCASLAAQGLLAELVVGYQQMLALQPNQAEILNSLGAAQQGLGRFAEAELNFRQATEIQPDFASAHNNLGTSLQEQGRLGEAEVSYLRALQINPDLAPAYSNLGNTLMKLGRLAEAEASYISALKITPLSAETQSNLGITLQELGRLAEAEASHRRALAAKPDFVEGLINLGNTLKDMARLTEAEASYRRALEIKPDSAEAHHNLGAILKEQGRYVEAATCYRAALEIKSDYAGAHQNLSALWAHLSDFRQVIEESDAAMAIKPVSAVTWEQRLYAFSYHPDLAVEKIFAEFVRWGDRFPDPAVDFSAHDRTRGRRLRVGYVSPDFRRHTSRFFFLPLFANHDPSAVELFAYANVKREDEFTDQFKGVFDHWRNIRGVSDVDAAQRIRDDGIDILVDCCNHMRDARLGVFVLKPAPIQVTWLGAAWTTGLKMIDYVLFDPYLAPQGTLARESIVRLPHCFVSFRPPDETAEVAPPPCLKNAHITFGYSGRTERLNHRTFRVWGEILKRLPTARLILDFGPFADPPTQRYYRQFLTEHGLDINRVLMRKSANIFAGLNDVDILLDCFPHSGGTMLFDALWMGVPVLTLASRPPLGRIGTSLMMNLGLPEWVAESEEDYIAKACALAQNTQNLTDLRAGMRERMQRSPVMDGAGFAGGVEVAYREMFDRWANAKPRTRPCDHELKALATLGDQGHHQEMEALARSLTQRFPENGVGWSALGTALQRLGQGAQALEALQKAAVLCPGNAEVHYNLGVCFKAQGLTRDAEDSYRKALAIKPEFAAAHSNLGNILMERDQYVEAENSYRRALTIKPDYAEAYLNLSTALKEQGRCLEAMGSCRMALSIKPDLADAHLALGTLLQEQGELSDSILSYQKALAINPKNAKAHNNLGNTFQKLGRLSDSEACYRSALALKPEHANVYNNLGNTLKELGRINEAEVCYRRALELQPDFEDAFGNLLFTLNYHPDRSGEEIFAAYAEFDSRFCRPYQDKRLGFKNQRVWPRRLKVGYVSPDFCSHSVQLFLEPLLSNHNKELVEVYAYSELATEDVVTKRYKTYVDHWIPTVGMPNVVLAERMRSDGIDILVDLAGHTANNRLGVFVLKPAPVSISWLGYGYTTGLTAIDYILTDVTSFPMGSEDLFSETPWRLDASNYVYRPAQGMGAVSELPALERGYVTFGTLTRSVRVNYRTIRVWSEILKRTEGSRLVLDSKNFQDEGLRKSLLTQFAAQGIGGDRLDIGYHSPPWDVLRGMDISLDCFPHNSGTTLFETLYMGVPFVTLAGRPSVGRLGSTVLSGVGHPEWIAQSEHEYIEKAVALAADLPKLKKLRSGLRHEMESSPLMDEKGFTCKVESAYREMFSKWALTCVAI